MVRIAALIVCAMILCVSSHAQEPPWSPVVSFTTGKPSELTSFQLDFGNVVVGTSLTKYLILTNIGASKIFVTNVTSTNPAFTPKRVFLAMDAYKKDSVGIIFMPTKNQKANSTISFFYNLSTTPQTMTVTGRGVSVSGKPNR